MLDPPLESQTGDFIDNAHPARFHSRRKYGYVSTIAPLWYLDPARKVGELVNVSLCAKLSRN